MSIEEETKLKACAKKIAAAGLALAMGLQLGPAALAAAPVEGCESGSALHLTQIARYTSGQFNVDGGVMEIVAYNSAAGCAYAINGQSGKLAVLSLEELNTAGAVDALAGTDIDVKALVEGADSSFAYGDMTSVAISPDGTTLAAALQAEGHEDPGRAAFFTCGDDGSLTLKGLVETGAQPDMITFADDDTALTADEGEPREGYGAGTVDPRGSVTVIDTASMTGTVVGFDDFDSRRAELAAGNVILQKDAAPSVDLEPEYIAVSGDKAYVTLQEANAVAVLDIASRSFDGIYSVGFEDYSVTPVDIDKKDDAYVPATYESLMGIRMPDGISAFTVGGTAYLVTANEGDAREWGDEDLGTFYLNEDERDFGEAGVTSPTGAITGENSGLTGKVVFFHSADYDGLDSARDYLYGGRTFTIFEVTGNGLREVFTSGDDFEALTAQYVPGYYNASNDNAVLDDRSGKKGPEPESVTVGEVDGRTCAFVALERTGGVMVYDVTDPASASFVNYINTRDFADTVPGSEVYDGDELDKWVTGGDVAPEGLAFIPADQSPTGEALLLTACEVSGTVAVYQVGGGALSVHPFSDVADGSAYSAAVAYVYEKGLMTGTGADTFSPDRALTRAEAVTALWKQAGSPAVDYLMNFDDVSQDDDCAEAVRWAASVGVAGGYGDGRFGPDDTVSREQLAVMLWRYAQRSGSSAPQSAALLEGYDDCAQVSGYAREAMGWTVRTGLLPDAGDNTLVPQGTVARAQLAVILTRLA